MPKTKWYSNPYHDEIYQAQKQKDKIDNEIIDSNPEYVNDISLRVYFANMAFCGDLSDVPDRMYRVLPNKK